MIVQIVDHAQTTDHELGILEQAAALYKQGLDDCPVAAGVRSELEYALENPNVGDALDRFRAARDKLDGLQSDITRLEGELQQFQQGLTADWIGEHGLAQSLPVNQWPWRDVMLGRRTNAFLTALASDESNIQSEERAFLFGATAGHAGNATLGAYLNHTVGGPRRSHPYRHRISAYTAGAYLRDSLPLKPATIGDLRTTLEAAFPASGGFPSSLKPLLLAALTEAYPGGVPQIGPDLDRGYRQLLRHLALLDAFPDPPLPLPVSLSLAKRIAAAGQLKPQGTGPTPEPGDPPVTQIGPDDDDESTCKKILAIIATVLIAIGAAILLLFSGGGGGGGAPDPATSQQTLQTWAASDDAAAAIQALFTLHMALVDALLTCRTALALRGMIYPQQDDFNDKSFSRFLTASYAFLESYPRRPDSASGPLDVPAATLEDSMTLPSPYAGGSPIAALGGPQSTTAMVLAMWEAALGDANSRLSGLNLDLDGDRGFNHQCWQLKPGSTMAQNPLDVEFGTRQRF